MLFCSALEQFVASKALLGAQLKQKYIQISLFIQLFWAISPNCAVSYYAGTPVSRRKDYISCALSLNLPWALTLTCLCVVICQRGWTMWELAETWTLHQEWTCRQYGSPSWMIWASLFWKGRKDLSLFSGCPPTEFWESRRKPWSLLMIQFQTVSVTNQRWVFKNSVVLVWTTGTVHFLFISVWLSIT